MRDKLGSGHLIKCKSPSAIAAARLDLTRLGEILPFGLLFKGLGDFLGENIVCFRYFKS